MGYSARYHAASLAAVFVALTVGILIGVGLGDNAVSGTEENLRESLEGDIDDARAEADRLRDELARADDFAERAFPALVGDVLSGRRIGLISIGGLSEELEQDVQEALDPTGAALVEVSVVERPPDVDALAAAVGRPFLGITEDNERLEALAERLGAQVARGRGRLLESARSVLFRRSSGEGGPLGGIVLTRASLGEQEPEGGAVIAAFITGFVRGIASRGQPTVAVEGSEVPESSVPFFSEFDIATVDSIDLVAGKVAMVFALLGADGNFGIKETADGLLPELLVPRRGAPPS